LQVEEHRTTADKRLDVPAELARVETPQLGQELTLAAGPFEQWTSHEASIQQLTNSPRHEFS
jgi:hypothetical protein